MRDAAVLVFVTTSLANILELISPASIVIRIRRSETRETTNRFDDRRLGQCGRLEVERASGVALSSV
jgi:hypothetical protein